MYGHFKSSTKKKKIVCWLNQHFRVSTKAKNYIKEKQNKLQSGVANLMEFNSSSSSSLVYFSKSEFKTLHRN